MNLFGDPFNLQGNNQNLQGGSIPLQGGANPQQVYGPYFTPKPATTPVRKPAPKPTAKPNLAPISKPIVAPTPTATPAVVSVPAPMAPLPTSIPLPTFAPEAVDPNRQFAEYAGMAGLGLDDFQKLLGGQYGLSQQEKDGIYQSYGIPNLESEAFARPTKSTEQLFYDAYNMAGLSSLKAQIDARINDINDRQKKYVDKEGVINENPFLSEASLIGRQKTLNDQKLADIGNLDNELSNLKDLYNAGLNEVNNLVTRQTADFNVNQQANQIKLQYLLGKAEQQIAAKQSEKSATALKYLPDFLKAKAKAQKPETIGSAEAGYYRWNPDTGTFEQVIAPKAPNDSFSLGFDPITGQPYVLNKNSGMLNTGEGGGGNVVANLAQQVTDNPALLYSLPEAQQKAVNAYLAGNGSQIPTQLTTEQKNKIASLGTLQQTIGAIESLGQQLNWSGVGGAFKGSISQFLAKNFGTGSQQEQMLRSYIGNLQATIAKERGGTSFTPNEQALLETYTPTINDSPLVIQSKLEALKSYLSGQVQGFGGQQTPQSEGVNPNDPLGLKSGFKSVGNTSASKFRTDRHNNPTAFTVNVAKTAGLKEGVDYTVGDPFPNNPKEKTARLIGDPIEQTIKVIDRIGFYTQSGKLRWTYTNSIPQTKNWPNLSYEQKASVIKQMYAHEGGKALLNYFA